MLKTATPRTVSKPPVRQRRSLGRMTANYGLPLALVLLVAAFSIMLPDTFPTPLNLRLILNDKSVVALLALAAMIPMTTDNWDLSVGFGVGLLHVVAFGLQVNQGVPWWVAAMVTVGLGTLLGFVNGLLVTRAKIHSFIATLGTGTLALGLAQWYTNGEQIVGAVSGGFLAIARSAFGVPLPAVYVAVVAGSLWVILEYLPVGRRLYVIGSNPRAAELVGIRVERHVVAAFVASGALTGFAGVVLASRLHVAQAAVGGEFLLPAFTAALLGATTIRPGRVNAAGTVLAILLLATAVAGLQQMGARFYTEAVFNGVMLLTAVGLAGYFARRQQRLASLVKVEARDVRASPVPAE